MNLLVLAGTEDGRGLASELESRGHQVWVSTLTEYGAEIAESQGLQTRFGALDEEELFSLLKQNLIMALIDATHPYAEKMHELAQKVCEQAGIPYLRWERPRIHTGDSPLIHWADGLEEAGKLASRLGRRIFLSTGSKNLKDWLQVPGFIEQEIFIRVLPSSEVLLHCEALGFKPYQIIAAQGPYTQRFNEALWEQLKIEVVITKESGQVGGTEEKIKACLELEIPIIVLKRPQREGPGRVETINEFLKRVEELK
ncbi:precorrin-6A reductase [Desulfitobacterium metallireducens]|uniref:Cobalt-precorrin-6A reductase n=1 Tax=Desulfitobacterium metallireducens DSM 15288 TaxID=871968 RepID=W0E9V8_9FIRM|nr:precorrin-6A reductase [Desulfitobacterium metallireducens]AHF06298.1 cobalt-precorrin-6A reductase [Desulfitobacterium metallireducens DSM 15288]